MLMGSMQPGSAAYGAYMQPGMYDPRDAMAASYGLGQLPGAHAHFRCFCCYACGIGYDGAYAERIGPIMTWGLCVLMLTSTPAVPCKQVACSTPCSSSYRRQLHQQQQQQAQQQAQKQQQPATQGWQEQANGAAASAQPLQQQQQQQPAAPEEPPVPCGGAAPAAGQEGGLNKTGFAFMQRSMVHCAAGDLLFLFTPAC